MSDPFVDRSIKYTVDGALQAGFLLRRSEVRLPSLLRGIARTEAAALIAVWKGSLDVLTQGGEKQKDELMPGTINDLANRFAIAAADLTRQSLDPEFASDSASVLFIVGPPLDQRGLDDWARLAKEGHIDLIYLAFEPGREEQGPSHISGLRVRRRQRQR